MCAYELLFLSHHRQEAALECLVVFDLDTRLKQQESEGNCWTTARMEKAFMPEGLFPRLQGAVVQEMEKTGGRQYGKMYKSQCRLSFGAHQFVIEHIPQLNAVKVKIAPRNPYAVVSRLIERQMEQVMTGFFLSASAMDTSERRKRVDFVVLLDLADLCSEHRKMGETYVPLADIKGGKLPEGLQLSDIKESRKAWVQPAITSTNEEFYHVYLACASDESPPGQCGAIFLLPTLEISTQYSQA